MKKRLVALILLCCTGFFLMACSNKATAVTSYLRKKQKTGNKKRKEDKNIISLSSNSKPGSSSWTFDERNTLSSHRFITADDFWICYKGIRYNLPISNSLFQDWTSNALNEIVRPGQYLIGVSYEKQGYESVSIIPYNDTRENLRVSKCKIAGITIRQPLEDYKDMEISLPCGITLGSTYDDVINTYGQATEDKININYPNYRAVTYKLDIYTYVRIGFTNNLVSFFEIRNMN